jgi:hypothetical protein
MPPLPALTLSGSSSASNPGGSQANSFNAAPAALPQMILFGGLAVLAFMVLHKALS